MIIRDLTTDKKWMALYKGFRFPNSPKGMVWKSVELTSKGKFRISRPVDGSGWGKRLMTRYVPPEQTVQFVPYLM